jgi:hypothetical protein
MRGIKNGNLRFFACIRVVLFYHFGGRMAAKATPRAT